MELGLYTFGDLVRHPKTGKSVSVAERMRQMLDVAVIADEPVSVSMPDGLGAYICRRSGKLFLDQATPMSFPVKR